MKKKLQKLFLTDYSLFIVQDLLLAYYQTLLKNFLKEFIKLNANIDMMIKNVKQVELTQINRLVSI